MQKSGDHFFWRAPFLPRNYAKFPIYGWKLPFSDFFVRF